MGGCLVQFRSLSGICLLMLVLAGRYCCVRYVVLFCLLLDIMKRKHLCLQIDFLYWIGMPFVAQSEAYFLTVT